MSVFKFMKIIIAFFYFFLYNEKMNKNLNTSENINNTEILEKEKADIKKLTDESLLISPSTKKTIYEALPKITPEKIHNLNIFLLDNTAKEETFLKMAMDKNPNFEKDFTGIIQTQLKTEKKEIESQSIAQDAAEADTLLNNLYT